MASVLGADTCDAVSAGMGSWPAFSVLGKRWENNDTVNLLMGLSLGLGLLSALATGCAFFWFVRMRRSFRHDLIMLLIQADFIKSLPYVWFPITQLVEGAIPSRSGLCQGSGWVLAFGVEASDVSVLLIAIHSALYIWRPRSGLYPYRWPSYAVYVFLPAIFASLVFKDGGYENLGSYCYLSRDHGWSRLALSWVPRYVLIAFIVVTYACIYGFVRIKLGSFARKQSSSQKSKSSSLTPMGFRELRTQRRQSQAPGMMLGGGWSNNETSSAQAGEPQEEQGGPFASTVQYTMPSWGTRRRSSVTDVNSSSCSSGRHGSYKSVQTPPITDTPAPESRIPEQASTEPLRTPEDITTSDTDTEAQAPRSMTLREMLQDDNAATLGPEPTRLNTLHNGPDADVERNRERIVRQLRSLIIYPLVYVITWTFPLVMQAYGQARPIGTPKPIWLRVLSHASFAAQGFANASVFLAHEKPWRHVKDRGFWKGVQGKVQVGRKRKRSGAGKGQTQDEWVVDRQQARARRAAELRAEEIEAENRDVKAAARSSRPMARRDWWDIDEIDADLEAGPSREQ